MLAVTASLLLTAPAARAAEYPSWEQVQSARESEASTAAQITELTGLLGDKLGGKVARTLAEQVALAEVDAHNMADIQRRLGRKPTLAVPELAGDVHDIEGLRALNRHLFWGQGESRLIRARTSTRRRPGRADPPAVPARAGRMSPAAGVRAREPRA